MTEEQPEEQRPEEQPPEEQPEKQPPEEQPEEQPDIGGEAKALRLVSRLAGAAYFRASNHSDKHRRTPPPLGIFLLDAAGVSAASERAAISAVTEREHVRPGVKQWAAGLLVVPDVGRAPPGVREVRVR